MLAKISETNNIILNIIILAVVNCPKMRIMCVYMLVRFDVHILTNDMIHDHANPHLCYFTIVLTAVLIHAANITNNSF